METMLQGLAALAYTHGRCLRVVFPNLAVLERDDHTLRWEGRGENWVMGNSLLGLIINTILVNTLHSRHEIVEDALLLP